MNSETVLYRGPSSWLTNDFKNTSSPKIFDQLLSVADEANTLVLTLAVVMGYSFTSLTALRYEPLQYVSDLADKCAYTHKAMTK